MSQNELEGKLLRDIAEAEMEVVKLEELEFRLAEQLKDVRKRLQSACCHRSGLIRDKTASLFGEQE
jgi:hypothetical protein